MVANFAELNSMLGERTVVRVYTDQGPEFANNIVRGAPVGVAILAPTLAGTTTGKGAGRSVYW